MRLSACLHEQKKIKLRNTISGSNEIIILFISGVFSQKTLVYRVRPVYWISFGHQTGYFFTFFFLVNIMISAVLALARHAHSTFFETFFTLAKEQKALKVICLNIKANHPLNNLTPEN